MSTNEYLTVGRIIRPHGIKGQLEILPLTDSSQRFQKGATFILKPPAPGMDSVVLRDVASKKGRVVAAVEGVDDRNGAEALVGRDLEIPAALGDKPADAYWHHDIIGCLVVTDTGRELGRVTEIIRTGGHDIYAIGEKRRYMVPVIKDVILAIDVEKKLITIKPLPGLLEL